MRIKSKRLLLRPLLLFQIIQGPVHGYNLLERLAEYGLADINPSLIYRALRNMELDGLIESRWEETESMGPPRRIYTATPKGRRFVALKMHELEATRDQIDKLLAAYARIKTGEFPLGKEVENDNE